MSTTYHVYNGHTLLYKIPHDQFYGILAGKPHLGGLNPMDGIAAINDVDNLRDATKEDFDFFRVCSKGYFNE